MTKKKNPAAVPPAAGGLGLKALSVCDLIPPSDQNHQQIILSGTTTDEETVETLQLMIKAAWQKSVTAIVETGQLLVEIRRRNPGRWVKIFDKDDRNRPFSYRMAIMLIDIAEHPVLSNVKHASHLPASWYTLFVLSKIDHDKLEQFIANKGKSIFSVHPGLQRNEAEILLRAQSSRERVHRGQGDQYIWRDQTDLPTKDTKSQKFVKGVLEKEIDEALGEIKRLINSLKKVHDKILKKPRWRKEAETLGDRLLFIAEPDPLSEYPVSPDVTSTTAVEMVS